MIYTTENYQKTFHPNKSVRTVRRMIKSKLLPSNHILIECSKDYLVNVMSTSEKAEFYLEKLLLFNRRKSRTIQDCAAFCVLNGIDDFQLFVKLANV